MTKENLMNLIKEECGEKCPYKECQYEKDIDAIAKEAGREENEAIMHIMKTAEDKQLVFGWANICKTADGQIPLDWSGDVMDAESLEPAAYAHVLKYRATGERHQGEAKGILVESVMFTKEKMAAMGIPEGIVPEGWWVGYYIPDKNVFAKCKDGTYNMFSIQGGGIRHNLKEAQDGQE